MLGLPIICYLFLGGTGAGACLVLAALGLLVPRDRITAAGAYGARGDVRAVLSVPPEYRSLFAPSYLAALGALLLGIVCLLVDMGRIDRVLLLFTHPSLSYLSVGAYALFACAVLAFAVGLFWLGILRVGGTRLLTVLESALVAIALVVAAYTGLLLQSLQAVPLWDTAWLPLLFVLSSASCGFALVLAATQFTGSSKAFARTVGRLTTWDGAVIAAEALVTVALVATVMAAASGAESTETSKAALGSLDYLLYGDYAALFWGGFVVVGLALPLMVELFSRHRHPLAPGVALLLAGCILVGGFLLRYCLVGAGMHPAVAVLGLG